MKKSFWKSCKSILPHLVLCLAVVFVVFLILNNYNPMMEFLSNRYSQILLWAFCVLAFIESVLFIIADRRGK